MIFSMKLFDWDPVKNMKLIQERGVSFEVLSYAIQTGGLLDVVRHPNVDQYQNQKLFIVLVDGYVYVVPFIETDDKVFLKTAFASRKATKKYLGVE